MLGASLILSLLLPKPKRRTEADPTSPNATAGAAVPRIFGRAIVGGLVIDSTTPSLEKKGGKGALGGGKNTGEEKFGTFQVLVGEGERVWNDKINDGFVVRLVEKVLEDPTVTALRGDIDENAAYRATKLASSNRYNDYEYSQNFISSTNTYSITLTTHINVSSVDIRGHCYYFIGNNWVIPSIDLPSLASVSSNFSMASGTPLTDVGLAFEQAGVLYFRGISLSPPYWYDASSGGLTGITISRSSLTNNSTNRWIAGEATHTPGLPNAGLNLTAGGAPITVWILLHSSNSGIGIPAGQQNFLSLSDIKISYVANDLNERGLLALEKIWMNDEIWYNTETTQEAQLKQNDKNAQYFTFYPGSLTQQQDPSLVSIRGANNVPGIQGYSHIVFHNLPLVTWSNNYPTVKVQVRSNLEPTPNVIIRDLLFRAGERYNKPLIEGKDWAWALNDNGTSAISPTSYSGVDIDGYVVSFDSADLKNYIAELSQIFRLAIVSNPALNYEFRTDTTFTNKVSPLYKVVPTEIAKTITVEAEVLGTGEADDDTLPWPTAIEGKSADEIPGQVEVQFHNLNKAGEKESVLLDRSTFQLASDYTFNPNYYADRKIDTARSIANFILFQGLARAKQITTTSFPNQLLGLQNLVEWEGELTLRPQKLTLGEDGVYEVVGIVITDEDLQESNVEDPINDLQDPGGVLTDVGVVWLEGQATLAPTTGNRRTIYAWLAPPPGTALGNNASILISFDGTSFNSTSINGQPPNAQQVVINSLPSENLNDFRYYNVDSLSSIVITVPDGIELLSVDLDSVLEGTKNIMYIPGFGLVGFQTATLTASKQYTLTDLYWNLGQTLIDEGWREARTASVGWLILGQPYEISIPSTVPKETEISLIAASAGSNSVPFTKAYEALNSSPRHVTNFQIEYNETNQDIRIDWIPYVNQATQLIPSLFEDPLVVGDTYKITILEGATVRRTITGHTARFLVYTEAQQTTDGVVSRANLTYEVIQEGDLNTMDTSVRYSYRGEIVSV